MGKRVSSLLLALLLCLGLLPGSAWAAEDELPEWRFLFAAFKNVDADYHQNGETKHTTYSMTQEEINFVREDARDFEEYMNQVGVMRACVDVVEIDETITELQDYGSSGGWLSVKQDAPLLEKSVDLNQYDHVTCIASLNASMGYLGLGGSSYENGTGHSFVNIKNRDYYLNVLIPTEKEFPVSRYVHEFLHFMETMDKKWGAEFGLHNIRIDHYSPDDDNGKACYTDIILNRARGAAGTGVHPVVWSHPPRVLRTMTGLDVPPGVAGIGSYAFQNRANLKKVTIPGSVAGIGANAFQNCANLAELNLCPGVAGIGKWAFQNCTSLTDVTIPGSVAAIEDCAFQDCTSLTELNLCPGVTTIGDWAFGCEAGEENRSALKEVAIPASVTSIGYAAFFNTSVTDVYYSGTREQWEAIQIADYNDALTKANIHCSTLMGGQELPNGTMAAGGQTVNWVYDPSSRSLTVSGGSDRSGTVFAARYDGSGRFLGLAEANGIQSFDLSGCGEARLFWMQDGTYTPLCGRARIPTGS